MKNKQLEKIGLELEKLNKIIVIIAEHYFNIKIEKTKQKRKDLENLLQKEKEPSYVR